MSTKTSTFLLAARNSGTSNRQVLSLPIPLSHCLIPQQWVIPKLEDPEPHYRFPDPDLLTSLVDLYFANTNTFLPLLHRHMFEKSLTDNLHRRDDGFGAVVLLVAAVGARFSDDPRVALPGTDAMHSAGWAWFNQVQMVRRSLFSPPSLYDLQIYCVRDHSPLSRYHTSYTLIG